MLDITVSWETVLEFFKGNPEAYGVEDQVDQLIFAGAQEEFGEEFDTNITSGGFDMIELYDNDGNPVDPARKNIPIRLAKMLGRVDWESIDDSNG